MLPESCFEVSKPPERQDNTDDLLSSPTKQNFITAIRPAPKTGKAIVFDTSLHPLVFEILVGLSKRYKTLIDQTVSNNLDQIKSKDDLQGCSEWNRNFKDINWVSR